MIEGIARAGNGAHLFAVHTESILGKCARLFRAGRTPFVENVTIDWGVPNDNFALPTVNFSTPSSSHNVRLRPAPVVQQSPASIKDIHAGIRLNIYAILTLRKTMVPKEVVLRGQLDGGGDSFELTVPIRGIQLEDSEHGPPLVHTVAAWRLIQDHQEKTAPLALAFNSAPEEEIRKASIVRLGERYQVVSRHTSFVAVDSGTDARPRARRGRSPSPRRSPMGSDTGQIPSSQSFITGLQGLIGSFFNPPPTPNAAAPGAGLPGAWPDADVDVTPPAESARLDPDEGYKSADTFSTLSSLDGSSDSEWSDWSDAAPPISEEDAQMQRSPSPKLEPLRLAPNPIREARKQRIAAAASEPPAPPPSVHPEVVRLASLQLFDGSFDDSIRSIVGSQIFTEAAVLQVDNVVWATAVSIAFMSKHLKDQKDLLDDLLRKAVAFLDGTPDARRLVQRAKELV
jgi:hypothetical protein